MITIIKAVNSDESSRDKPGILSKALEAAGGVSEEVPDKPLNMLGSAELNLPEHKAIIAERLGQVETVPALT